MRKLLYLCFTALLCHHVIHGQSHIDYLRQRAEKNLSSLTDSPTLLKRVRITDQGIEIFPKDQQVIPEFRVFWNEITQFINVIERQDYYTVQQLYKNKKSDRFIGKLKEGDRYDDFPTEMKGLKVAIDPGHFGGDIEEARLEGRMVKIRAEDLKQDHDIQFFEADLTFTTALILKRQLEAAGAQVMITRPWGAGAMGMNFSSWLKHSFYSDLERSFQLGDITRGNYDSLKKSYLDSARLHRRYPLFQFYKFLDFRERSAKINEFRPNITFVLHYNISEGSRPYGPERYIKPVTTDFSMAFVAGSFEYDEMEKSDQKVDFIRLLLSSDLDNSTRLAGIVLRKHKELLGVSPIPIENLLRMRKVIIPTAIPGVFSRNLYLTRSVRGTVVYSESLYQDNINEAFWLNDKDYTIKDSSDGTEFKTSRRCAEAAQAHFESVLEFLEQNKAKKEEYLASMSSMSARP